MKLEEDMYIERYKSYVDKYFLNSKKVILSSGKNPYITIQIFQKNYSLLCGINFVRSFIGNMRRDITIESLPDGTFIKPFETVARLNGRAVDLIDLETIYLGMLSRATNIATNVASLRKETDKNIFFFPARFDYYANQSIDGYAALVGGANDCSTNAQAKAFNTKGVGTMPHALIACYEGDVAEATLDMAKMYDREGIEAPLIALVDYNNNCVSDAVTTASKLYLKGFKLHGVRIDTSESMIDVSLIDEMGPTKKTGVCKEIVYKVRKALDGAGFHDVKIYVSGGFNAKKIKDFETNKVPVDGYGVGSICFDGKTDFTADVVSVNGKAQAKKGRRHLPITYRRN